MTSKSKNHIQQNVHDKANCRDYNVRHQPLEWKTLKGLGLWRTPIKNSSLWFPVKKINYSSWFNKSLENLYWISIFLVTLRFLGFFLFKETIQTIIFYFIFQENRYQSQDATMMKIYICCSYGFANGILVMIDIDEQ